jgi:putative restriction endonuclease
MSLRPNYLAEYLSGLDLGHRSALLWFGERVGAEIGWPGIQDTPAGPLLLATKAKGIYKPKWSSYALSVRHSLASPYPDLDPVAHNDGTWSYAYYQEGLDPAQRDEEFTNRALMQCVADQVPVAVFRQLAGHPTRYQVLGLALVAGWGNGYFLFDGFATDGYGRRHQVPHEIPRDTNFVVSEKVPGLFDTSNVIDARARVIAQVVQRRGQPQFRNRLLIAYENRCAISACDAPQALEACHIFPYLGAHTNVTTNGLLLRADLHTIFDLGLIAVNPMSLKLEVSKNLAATQYAELSGVPLRVPKSQSDEPSRNCLAAHREWAGF